MKVYLIKVFLTILSVFSFGTLFSQQKITGKITSENEMIINSVLVVNISKDKKVNSDTEGNFTIEAVPGDEIRFLKKGYERNSHIVLDQNAFLKIILIRIPEEIEEVEIITITGDLEKDSKRLTKIDKAEELRKSIGLPKAPDVARERIPTWRSVFAIGIPNIFDLYKMLSGDARRMKSLYKYDDTQRYADFITTRTENEYFEELGIPKEDIRQFLEYSFIENPIVVDYIKNKNIVAALFEIEKTVPKFVERINERNSQGKDENQSDESGI